MIRVMLAAAVLGLSAQGAQAGTGRFLGELHLSEPGLCNRPGDKRLLRGLGYVDSRYTHQVPPARGWYAPEGNCTDGASIPWVVQGIIGDPFDPRFVRAAVIHDHYCNRKVANFLETHWVFYDALLADGVEHGLAEVMYFAVLVGGPRWLRLRPSQPCPLGFACVMATPMRSLPPEVDRVVDTDSGPVAYRAPRFDDPGVEAAIAAFAAETEARDAPLGAEAVLARALEVIGKDLFTERQGEAVTFAPAPAQDQ
jgi:hypothetical protein